MKSFWEGDPVWPEQLSAAVADRVIKCKVDLIHFVVDQVLRGKHPSGEDDLVFEQYLLLDEETLETLLPHKAQRARQIGAEAEADIEALLTDDQRREFRKVGFRSFLARVDCISWDVELMRKMNGLPALAGTVREDYSDYFCPKPFEMADIGEGGKVNLCCALWLPESAGNYESGTFMEVWNSEKAQAIRRSILDGSYSYCIEQHCPHLQNKTLPKRDDVRDPEYRDIIDNNRVVLDRGPRDIVLSYDKSCNLACRTCRVEPIMLTGRARSEVENIQDWATTGEHLKDCRKMDITLSGDAFGSPVFFKFLREFDSSSYPDLRITLCTNGLLLTERNWNSICNEAINIVYISIDAATPETYAVNRGGDFERLMEHLKFVGSLRSRGKLERFVISFVVQANNYREMPAFASLGQSVNADAVMFIQVGNPGHFTNEEFERRAVHLESHSEHSHLLEVLQDPRLGIPIVDLRNFDGLQAEPDVGEMLRTALSVPASELPGPHNEELERGRY